MFPKALVVPLLSSLLVLAQGCAARQAPLRAELAHVALAEARAPVPQVLTQNHFTRDQAGGVSEAALRQILAAPVYLEEKARVGVVPVRGAYAPDTEVPLTGVPAALVDALDSSGQFELACEVSTDFPTDRGISGLRELAARYRADYLLIYRHRFVERRYRNAAAWAWVTGVGALVVKGRTLEAAGVLEATLFDVKTGTLLFTVLERVHGEEKVTPFHPELKAARLQRRLLEEAGDRLAEQMMARVHRLVAARPGPPADTLLSSAAVLHPEPVQFQEAR
jgi:hypothetical protein